MYRSADGNLGSHHYVVSIYYCCFFFFKVTTLTNITENRDRQIGPGIEPRGNPTFRI
jgi:hypothetical protein